MSIASIFISAALGLTASNFIWQMFEGNWPSAFERSFFQLSALGLVWLVLWINGHLSAA